MRILIAPNAFKGSLTSPQAAQAIARGLERSLPDADLDLMPIADGGDDTVEVLCPRIVEVEVEDPLGRPIRAGLGLMADGQTAVVEMARASGLKLLRPEEYDPRKTSTRGVGQLILAAAERGVRRIIVGMGGSATVDGGAGCLTAMGAEFLDAKGRPVPPGGGGLGQVRRVDVSGLAPALEGLELVVACDVDNPAVGPQGSAVIFGPQKGASAEDAKKLDANLTHFFTLIRDTLGVDVLRLPRGGAAGALAAGLHALAAARLESGIELILDHLGADERVARADLVVTGEGRLDSQTLSGKGPHGLATIARRHGRPVVALVGSVGEGDFAAAGFAVVRPITPESMSLEDALARAPQLMEAAAERLGQRLREGRLIGSSGAAGSD